MMSQGFMKIFQHTSPPLEACILQNFCISPVLPMPTRAWIDSLTCFKLQVAQRKPELPTVTCLRTDVLVVGNINQLLRTVTFRYTF